MRKFLPIVMLVFAAASTAKAQSLTAEKEQALPATENPNAHATKNTDVGNLGFSTISEVLNGGKKKDDTYRIGYTEKGVTSAYRKKKYLQDTTAAPASAPFAWGDFSWMNGQSRKTTAPTFDSKYFTGDITFDLNSTYSFADPIDNTVVGSTALSRNNELQLSFVGFGGDIHYGNVRGRIMMQFGTRSTVVPRNDISSYKGQYDFGVVGKLLILIAN